MDRPSVKLVLEFSASEWETLIELSQSQNDTSPKETVLYWVWSNVKVFLSGKAVGMKELGESISKKLNEKS